MLMSAAPANSRSRKGAWIEMLVENTVTILFVVAPARERGLKYTSVGFETLRETSLPQGSVD